MEAFRPSPDFRRITICAAAWNKLMGASEGSVKRISCDEERFPLETRRETVTVEMPLKVKPSEVHPSILCGGHTPLARVATGPHKAFKEYYETEFKV